MLKRLCGPFYPLISIEKFLAHDNRFEIDTTKTNRFLITHHPKGWLRRL